jgi:predicted DNA-binding protein
MMVHQKGRQAQVTLYLAPETLKQVQALSLRTRIPQAALFREAIDDLLQKHSEPKKKSSK